MNDWILEKIADEWSKGGITARKLVLIVIGVSVTAIVIMTIRSGIESAYTEGLENALENH
ncbi:hypothetical protein AQV86_05725 [Nanohaloarchaea archaeon SG9]|nr:hypothetical protein AQV86_05725 [Nanohaloarchaea archaeon SG9]